MDEELQEIVEIEEIEDSSSVNKNKQRLVVASIIVIVVLLLAGIVFAVLGLLKDADTTSNIRDIFIIFMAFESLLIGAALVILIIQIASLINLIQNEVKPILESTTDTVNTLRGTTAFLSENMVEPVIKLNSYLAGLKKFTDLVSLKKK